MRVFFKAKNEEGREPRAVISGEPGLILVFVIVITLLIALMGVIIMAVTKSEISLSGHYKRSQEAFNSTDSSASLGVLLGRVVLHPVLGNPQDLLRDGSGAKSRYPLTVEINHERFNLSVLVEEAEPFDFAKRYRESSFDDNSGAQKPHLTFKVNGKTVATASVSLDLAVAQDGYSLAGGDRYDPASGGTLPVDLVLSVTGTSASEPRKDDLNAPRSVITTITRDLM